MVLGRNFLLGTGVVTVLTCVGCPWRCNVANVMHVMQHDPQAFCSSMFKYMLTYVHVQVCALRESYEVEAEVQAEIAALSLKQARASGTLPPGPIRILLALSGTLASKLGTALKSLPAKARVLLGPKEVSGTAAPGTGNTPTTSSSTGVSK